MTERMTLQSALQAVRESDDGLYGVHSGSVNVRDGRDVAVDFPMTRTDCGDLGL